MALATNRPPCIATGASCGSGVPSAARSAARSPTTNTSGRPATERPGPTITSPRDVETERDAERVRGDARGPDHRHGREYAAVGQPDLGGGDRRDRRAEQHLHAARLELALRLVAGSGRERTEHRVPHLDEHDTR